MIALESADKNPDVISVSHRPGWYEAEFLAGCGHIVTAGSQLRITADGAQKMRDRFYSEECPECRRC